MGEIVDHRNADPATRRPNLAARRGPADRRASATWRTRRAFGDPDRTGSPLYVKEPGDRRLLPRQRRRPLQQRRRQQDGLPDLAGRHVQRPDHHRHRRRRHRPAKTGQALPAASTSRSPRAATTPTSACVLDQSCQTLWQRHRRLHGGELHQRRTRRRSRPSCAATPADQPAAGRRHDQLPDRHDDARALQQRDRARRRPSSRPGRLWSRDDGRSGAATPRRGTDAWTERPAPTPSRRPRLVVADRGGADRAPGRTGRPTCTSSSGGSSTTTPAAARATTTAARSRSTTWDAAPPVDVATCRGSTARNRCRQRLRQPGRGPEGLRRGQPRLGRQPARPVVASPARASSRSSR